MLFNPNTMGDFMHHKDHHGHHDGKHVHKGHMDHHSSHMAHKHHGHHSNPLGFSHVGMSQAHGIKK